MKLIELTAFYANRTSPYSRHGKPIYLNPERFAAIDTVEVTVVNTDEEAKTPVNQRPKETYTQIDLVPGGEEGGVYQVQETPEEIFGIIDEAYANSMANSSFVLIKKRT